MQKDPRRRLGCGPGGMNEVMAHPFFAGIDWVAIELKQVTPPFKPSVNVLDSVKTVRSWSDKDKAKLATIAVTPADQVMSQTTRNGAAVRPQPISPPPPPPPPTTTTSTAGQVQGHSVLLTEGSVQRDHPEPVLRASVVDATASSSRFYRKAT